MPRCAWASAGDLLLIFADALVRSWKQVIKFRPKGVPEARVPENIACTSRPTPAVQTEASLHPQPMGRRGPRRARHPSVPGAGRLSAQAPLPFEDSRRLTGPNLYFTEPGAVLDTVGPGGDDARVIAAWRDNVLRMRNALGWPAAPISVRAASRRRRPRLRRAARPVVHRHRGQRMGLAGCARRSRTVRPGTRLRHRQRIRHADAAAACRRRAQSGADGSARRRQDAPCTDRAR